MDRVVRIGLLFNLVALGSYLTIVAWVIVVHPVDQTFVSVTLANLWSAGVTVRFLLALRKHGGWGLDIAANWGFFLAVSQFVAFQMSSHEAIYAYVAFVLVTGQLLIVYKPNRAVVFTGLLAVLYGIRLISTDASQMLIMVLGLWVFGVLFRLSLSLLIQEVDTQRALFMKARWAASELTDVLLHLDIQLEQARVFERMQMQRSLAREIHDSVGYMLTALIVQIGVVREIASSESVKTRLEKLEDLARETLRAIREEVSNLRNRPTRHSHVAGVYDRITQLCAVFAECTGVGIRLNMREELRELLDNDGVGESLYRIVQEALTNSYRHGSAELVDITLQIEPTKHLLMLLVSDNGKGCKTVTPGNGLSGILERTRGIGGTMKTNTAPGKGFDVGIDIPLGSLGASRSAEQTGGLLYAER